MAFNSTLDELVKRLNLKARDQYVKPAALAIVGPILSQQLMKAEVNIKLKEGPFQWHLYDAFHIYALGGENQSRLDPREWRAYTMAAVTAELDYEEAFGLNHLSHKVNEMTYWGNWIDATETFRTTLLAKQMRVSVGTYKLDHGGEAWPLAEVDRAAFRFQDPYVVAFHDESKSYFLSQNPRLRNLPLHELQQLFRLVETHYRRPATCSADAPAVLALALGCGNITDQSRVFEAIQQARKCSAYANLSLSWIAPPDADDAIFLGLWYFLSGNGTTGEDRAAWNALVWEVEHNWTPKQHMKVLWGTWVDLIEYRRLRFLHESLRHAGRRASHDETFELVEHESEGIREEGFQDVEKHKHLAIGRPLPRFRLESWKMSAEETAADAGFAHVDSESDDEWVK